jgi:hypothetical protein
MPVPVRSPLGRESRTEGEAGGDMRHVTLALALAVGISGCFEAGQRVMPEASPGPTPGASPEPSPEVSPETPASSPLPLPRPFLPFVKRLQGLDRLFLYDAIAQEIVEIPEAVTGGPILNPFYFERHGEGRILYNSGGVIECPEGSGFVVPDLEGFGAYVLDPLRRLRYRLSEDDYFRSAATADGRLFVHLDVTEFPPPQRIALILEGEDEPFDEETILASLDQEPGLLVDLSIAPFGRWIAAVKGPVLASTCGFPPPVDGRLYLYDLASFRLFQLSELFKLPPVQAAALSPSGRYVVLLTGGQLRLLDRESGNVDPLPVLNQSRGEGTFRTVRFLAGVEEVFYLELRAPGGRSRIMAYDWRLQVVNLLPMVNGLDEPADLYLAPPY